MDRTLSADDEPPVDARRPMETALGRDLTDATLNDEGDKQDTQKLYTEDEILPKLESAMVAASGGVKSDIQAAIEDRKKELRNKQMTLGNHSSKSTGTGSPLTSNPSQ